MDSAAAMTAYVADHVIRLGRGEPMMLVHGLGHCKEAWDPVLPALAGRFDVCALDLPGFGGAAPLAVGHGDVALTDWCQTVMDEMGWDTAHIVGNSLGGVIGLRLAAAGRARSVTALSPAGQMVGWEETYGKAVLRIMHAIAPGLRAVPAVMDTSIGRQLVYSITFGRPARMTPGYARLSMDALCDTEVFLDALDAVTAVVEGLPAPVVPTTIAWGTRDYLLLPRQGRRWVEALPGSRLVKLPGLGHTPMPDDPAMVMEVITRTAAAAAPHTVAT